MPASDIPPLRAGMDTINRGDVEGTVELCADDVVFIAARSSVEGAYHGHDGMRRFLADNADSFEVFHIDVTEVRTAGDSLLVLGTLLTRGRGGVETEIPVAGVARFADGRLKLWEDFREERLAREALGLDA